MNITDIDCNLLTVDIFDKFAQNNIVRENGSIRKCLDEYFESLILSDELRKVKKNNLIYKLAYCYLYLNPNMKIGISFRGIRKL